MDEWSSHPDLFSSLHTSFCVLPLRPQSRRGTSSSLRLSPSTHIRFLVPFLLLPGTTFRSLPVGVERGRDPDPETSDVIPGALILPGSRSGGEFFLPLFSLKFLSLTSVPYADERFTYFLSLMIYIETAKVVSVKITKLI